MGKVNFEITTTALKGTLPRVPFENIKRKILGDSYDLSLVLIGDTLGKRLNKEHKNKNAPTNVLSFPLAKSEGEIFLNVRRAQRDARKFGHTPHEHVAFLFIHGCLHLKGFAHSRKMEEEEELLLKKLLK
ncbi:rRNA maturation RNase YbeY [bacterium]|nr:rRNA maturation RNase YbeY [bacterium]|tara:strand:+ start:267 stop:656 length:390 start_codon:yes stop_codon:yes gene_type:complete